MSVKEYGFQEVGHSTVHNDGVRASIPKHIRDYLNIRANDELVWVVEDDVLHVHKKSEIMGR